MKERRVAVTAAVISGLEINCWKYADSVIDIDGNIYHTVIISTQTWMVENLKTTKYNDNTTIPLVADPSVWTALTTPGYCWYDNDEGTYKATYGALYNWYAVDAAGNGGKNVCPTGWHVPADADWTILTTYLGGLSVAGGKLKETGTTHWTTPNTGATNQTGFTALPGGSRSGKGIYIGLFGTWWSSTEDPATNAWNRSMSYSSPEVGRYSNVKHDGFSIRCLMD